jgi:formylglycine-generating enzyme required for sulfatase activity
MTMRLFHFLAFFCGASALIAALATGTSKADGVNSKTPDFKALRLAINDLIATHGGDYPQGAQYLARLDKLEAAAVPTRLDNVKAFRLLQREALLANPLLDFEELIVLKRKRGELGLPTNHQCNSCLKHTGYGNEIIAVSALGRANRQRTVYKPERDYYVGEIDLHFDGDKMLFSMPAGGNFEIHEINADGAGLRQVSKSRALVDNFDPCYLPNGRIVYASTASFTGVPCWHGKERACGIFSMNNDGSGVRQLCFDQDLDLHPSVMPNGQVIYSRWDYTGIMHMYLRPVMAMNPDGTGQRALYGSNSYYPNALYYPRALPGDSTKLIAVVSGYHGVNRMGELAIIDTAKGWRSIDGFVQRLAHRNEPTVPVIIDNAVDKCWPKFLHPYPLSDKYFLASGWMNRMSPWGIYLVDVFDNVVPLLIDKEQDYFEPLPLRKTPKPKVIPDRVDLTKDDATIYLHDIYAGPGLKDVPRGAVKNLRVVAYDFGFPGMAGPDKIGCGGPWESMRILGTVPVHEDGSVAFRVPANTPLTVQPLDDEGKALQLMRSWFTAMPGEVVSCVGCHEQPKDTPMVRYESAAAQQPLDLTPWHGPARGFDFEREVQPVLDEFCVGCHNGGDGDMVATPDLRGEEHFPDYKGRQLARLGASRLHSELVEHFDGTRIKYTPAYETLAPYIRRVGIEDDVELLPPGEYHANTSELIQMLRKGHHGVKLDDEAWDRLVTWIDLNGPCHGTWNDVGPLPGRPDVRRREIALAYAGPTNNLDQLPEITRWPIEPIIPTPPKRAAAPKVAGWPFTAAEAKARQAADGPFERTIALAEGVELRLVKVPQGTFVMGGDGPKQTVAKIDRDYWIGACEITNAQYRLFDPNHRTGYFMKRYPGKNGPGLALDGAEQPVIRVSWQQATDFCEWLSKETGKKFTLPTDKQWEYAARAGTGTPLSYGGVSDDFSRVANMADQALAAPPPETGGLTSSITGVMEQSIFGGDIPCVKGFDDGAVATANVGNYQPNAWGVYDMHGNVAEWTSSVAPNDSSQIKYIVRGGSFRDRPHRCTSSFSYSYPAWQRVHNVGFRVVCLE